ncbi:MAG: rod shape-determining protein MreC [Bacteroidales bacterium]|nr:rod shape-determining protein MreC [Bacteroidales bacterium]MDD3521882.1 rod shape-determining protein MreC [Bacteroidales bacterium]MDD4030918.1 rod shape-determining protein MreC [Bacteroidales bacterium]MDD4435644.1 rod shape-determining protein MreC [Bacteroidales bacterium]
MSGLPPLLRKLLVLLLFLALQSVAVVLLVNNSYFQQNVIMRVVRSWQTKWWEKTSSWTAFTNLRKINDDLFLENARLRAELARLSELELFLTAQDSLRMASTDSFSFIPARVIRNSVNRQRNTLIIDKGSADGISPDMGVISARGIVGVVSHVSEHYAMIISLLNTEQRFTAELKKTGTFGTLRWNGIHYRKVTLSEIPLHIEVNPGDTVVSNDFSLVFPRSVPIGLVLSGSLKQGSFLELDVELFSDFKTLRYVNVVSFSGADDLLKLTDMDMEEAL